jgi:anaerobic magnesium-protoporphyrin IX monomethyl ester cyclase
MEERYGSLAGAGSSLPSLGILFLAAVTRKNGFPTLLVDAAALNFGPEGLLLRVKEAHPDVLGLSATTFSICHAAAFAARVKALFPDITVIIGGPHVSAAPRETMERFHEFDVAVVGEGEETIIELLKTLDSGASIDALPGTVVRREGQVAVNARRSFLADLDTLPYPAWDILEGFPGHLQGKEAAGRLAGDLARLPESLHLLRSFCLWIQLSRFFCRVCRGDGQIPGRAVRGSRVQLRRRHLYNL